MEKGKDGGDWTGICRNQNGIAIIRGEFSRDLLIVWAGLMKTTSLGKGLMSSVCRGRGRAKEPPPAVTPPLENEESMDLVAH